MKINKYIFWLFICLFSCKVQENYDCNLPKETTVPMSLQEVSQKMLSLNKQIIPCLIDSIDVDRISLIGFINPIQSNLTRNISQVGMWNAYWIDFILLKDSIETVKKIWRSDTEDSIEDRLEHWSEWIKPYRIYNAGTIMKLYEDNKPMWNYTLTHKDMVAIKKMYSDWWRKNKNKQIHRNIKSGI